MWVLIAIALVLLVFATVVTVWLVSKIKYYDVSITVSSCINLCNPLHVTISREGYVTDFIEVYESTVISVKYGSTLELQWVNENGVNMTKYINVNGDREEVLYE